VCYSSGEMGVSGVWVTLRQEEDFCSRFSFKNLRESNLLVPVKALTAGRTSKSSVACLDSRSGDYFFHREEFYGIRLL